MAKLYTGNFGSNDLQTSTLDAFRLLSGSWKVVLNFRPVGHGVAREVDALLITEYALHIIELKYRREPIHIQTEDAWYAGRQPMLNGSESPAKQAVATKDAFKEWLGSIPQLSNLQRRIMPWVVLENFNPENTIGPVAKPRRLAEDRYEDVGHAKVVHGTSHLGEIIARREKGLRNSSEGNISTELVDILFKEINAKKLDELSIYGLVRLLDGGHALPDISVQVRSLSQTAQRMSFTTTTKTDEEGKFEFIGVPLGEFSLDVPDVKNYRVLPSGVRSSNNSVAYAPVYITSSSMDEPRVQALIEQHLQNVESEVRDFVLKSNADLEARVFAEIDAVHRVKEASDMLGGEVENIKQELETLRRKRHRAEVLREIDSAAFINNALEPLQKDLETIRRVAQHAVETAREAHRISQEARDHAQAAAEASNYSSQAAAEAASEASQSRVAQETLVALEHERAEEKKAEKLARKEADYKRMEALKISAIVGAAGGMVSMQPLPFADNLIITPMQIGLVIWVGKIYGQSLTSDMALKLVGTAGYGFLAQHATIALYKLIPGLTFGLGPITVSVFTILLGAMMSFYYERGRFPNGSEQKRLISAIRRALVDEQLKKQLSELGQIVASDLKTRKYKVKAEDMREIFGKVSTHGRDIGVRLNEVVRLDDLKTT